MWKTSLIVLMAHTGAVTAAEPLDAAVIASCMIEKTTDLQVTPFKSMMVAAFQDDVPGMQTAVAALGMAISTLAMTECSVGLSQLSDPAFVAAAEKYGEALGQKLIGEALAKLN